MIDLLGIESSKVYALVRVSSNLQDFQSQMQGIQSYCKNNNINLLKENIIEEQGISGFKTEINKRQGLNKILDLAKANKIQMLIVFNQDRLRKKNRDYKLYKSIDKVRRFNC